LSGLIAGAGRGLEQLRGQRAKALAKDGAYGVGIPTGGARATVGSEQFGGFEGAETGNGAEHKDGAQIGGKLLKPGAHTTAVRAGDHALKLIAGDAGRFKIVVVDAGA
jgi:hypothetical protein